MTEPTEHHIEMETCPTCNGTGVALLPVEGSDRPSRQMCPDCGGTGFVPKQEAGAEG